VRGLTSHPPPSLAAVLDALLPPQAPWPLKALSLQHISLSGPACLGCEGQLAAVTDLELGKCRMDDKAVLTTLLLQLPALREENVALVVSCHVRQARTAEQVAHTPTQSWHGGTSAAPLEGIKPSRWTKVMFAALLDLPCEHQGLPSLGTSPVTSALFSDGRAGASKPSTSEGREACFAPSMPAALPRNWLV
jgi:hypothetical protein